MSLFLKIRKLVNKRIKEDQGRKTEITRMRKMRILQAVPIVVGLLGSASPKVSIGHQNHLVQ